MLDTSNRITIGGELMLRSNLKANQKIDIFFDHMEKKLLFLPSDEVNNTDMYFVASHGIDSKNRVIIPKTIRDIFPKASYLPVERNGKIYVLII